MHRTGHIGVALAVYAPVAYVLVSAGQGTLAALGVIGMVVIEPLPDRDMEIPGLKHRGASHTLVGALFIGLGVAGAVVVGDRVMTGYLGVSVIESVARSGGVEMLSETTAEGPTLDVTATAGFAFAIGVLAVVAHLLSDVLTPMGIRPFWPVSRRRVSLGVWTASNRIANPALLVLGVGALASAVWTSIGGPVSAGEIVETVFREVLS